MTTQYTPGPWRVYFEEEASAAEPRREWLTIATVDPQDGSMGDEVAVVNVSRTEGGQRYEAGHLAELEANARLIAAAPKMLEALELAKEILLTLAMKDGDNPYWNEGGEGYAAWEIARAAIAEAKGGLT